MEGGELRQLWLIEGKYLNVLQRTGKSLTQIIQGST